MITGCHCVSLLYFGTSLVIKYVRMLQIGLNSCICDCSVMVEVVDRLIPPVNVLALARL